MGQQGAQIVKEHSKALMASDPNNNKHLFEHYEGPSKYSDKLNFALQLRPDRFVIFMTATEAHCNACVDKSGFENGWMTEFMVANKDWSVPMVH
jgi:hypothetical protein